MTVKSSMTKPDRKRKVKVNRDAVVVEYVVPEVIAPIPEVAEEPLVEVLKEMGITDKDKQAEQLEKAKIFIDTHGIDEVEKLVNLMDESSYSGNDPTSPVSSPKRVRLKKPSAPKSLVNEKGEYLNPRTNRYVKSGTTAFKQLVKEKIIVIDEAVSV